MPNLRFPATWMWRQHDLALFGFLALLYQYKKPREREINLCISHWCSQVSVSNISLFLYLTSFFRAQTHSIVDHPSARDFGNWSKSSQPYWNPDYFSFALAGLFAALILTWSIKARIEMHLIPLHLLRSKQHRRTHRDTSRVYHQRSSLKFSTFIAINTRIQLHLVTRGG